MENAVYRIGKTENVVLMQYIPTKKIRTIEYLSSADLGWRNEARLTERIRCCLFQHHKHLAQK